MPTKRELDAAAKVYKAMKWLPDYSSKDEIISAYNHLAIKLQMKLDKLAEKSHD
jgi:hypothetical protein